MLSGLKVFQGSTGSDVVEFPWRESYTPKVPSQSHDPGQQVLPTWPKHGTRDIAAAIYVTVLGVPRGRPSLPARGGNAQVCSGTLSEDRPFSIHLQSLGCHREGRPTAAIYVTARAAPRAHYEILLGHGLHLWLL